MSRSTATFPRGNTTMRNVLRGLAGLATAGLVLVASGCNDGRPSVESSTTEATVKGTVSIRGKPAPGGTVSFDPSNVSRKMEAARAAPIGKDGTYEVKTLIGLNRVSFSGPAFARERELQDATFQCDVQRGEQTYNMDLP